MPMSHIFLSCRCGAGSEDSARLSQGCPPLHDIAWRGKQKLRAQLNPCPCPAMTPVSSFLASRSFSQVVVRSQVNLPWEKLLLCPTVCPQSCRSQTFAALKSGHRGMFVHHPVPCMATLHLPLPLLLVSGRRAGAHVSPATCKSTDIIRAVVDGITRASACKAQVPCLRRWPGAPTRRGVRLVLILANPLGVGWLLGWGGGLHTAVVGLPETGICGDVLSKTRIFPHFRVFFHHAGVKQCSATPAVCLGSAHPLEL